MRNRNYSWLPALWLGLVLLLSACSTKTIVESDLGVRGAPDWVNEGTQILNDRNGRLFHGVGQAPAMGDESLQISTSDNRARAEVARVLSSYMDVVSNDYTTAVNSGGEGINEQSVTQQIQNFTKLNLSGAKIIAHWRDKKTQTIYSLAELDLKQTKKTLAATSDMNADLRRYIESHGDNVFDRLTGGRN